MKMKARPNAMRKFWPVRLISFDWPKGAKRYSAGRCMPVMIFSSAVPTSAAPTPGAEFAKNVTWR